MLIISERVCDDLRLITFQVLASHFQISDMGSVQQDLGNVCHACQVNKWDFFLFQIKEILLAFCLMENSQSWELVQWFGKFWKPWRLTKSRPAFLSCYYQDSLQMYFLPQWWRAVEEDPWSMQEILDLLKKRKKKVVSQSNKSSACCLDFASSLITHSAFSVRSVAA